MNKEFAGVVDLSSLHSGPEGAGSVDGEIIRERYTHMAMEPDTFAQMPWIDELMHRRPEDVVLTPRIGAVADGSQVMPEDLFRTYVTYVAKSSSGLFGVKKKLVADLLESKEGVNRFRTAVVQSCTMHYPGPYGDLEPFTHRYVSYWNTWQLPFVQGVVPDATTEELQRMHVEQRIQLPSDAPSGLILPS